MQTAQKNGKTILVGLYNEPDSIMALETLNKYKYKTENTIFVVKSPNLKQELEELYAKDVVNVVFVGFIPYENILKELNEKDIYLYTKEKVGEKIEPYFKQIYSYFDTSISYGVFSELTRPTEEVPEIIQLVESMQKRSKTDKLMQMYKLLNYSSVMDLYKNPNKIECFNYAATYINKLLYSSARRSENEVNFFQFNDIKIPVINSFKQQNNILGTLFFNTNYGIQYEIVGLYTILGNGKVQVSIRSKGKIDLKKLYETYNGSGNKYVGGFTIDLKEFINKFL